MIPAISSTFISRLNKRLFFAVVPVLLLAACSGGSDSLPEILGGGGGNNQTGGAGQSVERPAPATGEDAYQYVLEYTAFAPYRTGTEGDHRMHDWMADEFEVMGYQVEVEEFPFERFVNAKSQLQIGDFEPAVFPLYYSGNTGAEGIHASIVDIGLGTPLEAGSAEGAIAFLEMESVLNFLSPTFEQRVGFAAAGGAKALVISFMGPLNEILAKNVDARTGLCGFPILVVGKEDGKAIKALSGSEAHFVLDASTVDAVYSNVVATLPGTGEGVIVVGTPINPWFTSAVERGGGVAGLLTLARYFAEQGPQSKTLIFVGTGAHEVGFLGLQSFLDARPGLAEQIETYVHLGASIASELIAEVNGEEVRTGLPYMSNLYVSENPVLLPMALASFQGAGATTTVPIPPAALNPGEQSTMYKAGVPIVSISGSHFYFHTSRDLPDLLTAELLHPIVSGFKSVIDQLLTMDGGQIRQVNVVAGSQAAEPAEPGECLVPLSES